MVRSVPLLSFLPYLPEPPIQLDSVGQLLPGLAMLVLQALPEHLDSRNGASPDLQLLFTPFLKHHLSIHLLMANSR